MPVAVVECALVLFERFRFYGWILPVCHWSHSVYIYVYINIYMYIYMYLEDLVVAIGIERREERNPV